MTRNIENRGEEGKEEEAAVGGVEGKCCHSVIDLSFPFQRASPLPPEGLSVLPLLQ